MEFSEQYLTYEEYRSLGGTLDLASFNLLEFEARRKIDIRTQNRLKKADTSDIPQEVKLCVYKMINSIHGYNNSVDSVAARGNLSSVNTDGYSESYITPAQIEDIVKSKSAELNDIIRNYLLEVVFDGEHLMYLGVD